MKADAKLVKSVAAMVKTGNEQAKIGGKLAINSCLLIFSNCFKNCPTSVLEMELDALNQVDVSMMREEYILVLEGLLAIREIKPMMDTTPVCKKNYGKAHVCQSCLSVQAFGTYTCSNCGSIME